MLGPWVCLVIAVLLCCAGTFLLSNCHTQSWAARWWIASTSDLRHSQVCYAVQ